MSSVIAAEACPSIRCTAFTFAPELIASGLPIGLVLAGGGYLGASRTLEKRRARIDEGLHILLDRLAPRH